MDRFLYKACQQNSQNELTKFGPAVCVIGPCGIGKTWTAKKELGSWIELGPDILKSKNDTVEFLNKIRGTSHNILIDEYECIFELIGLREIKEPPTSGLFVVTSQIPVKFDFEIKLWELPIKSQAEIKILFPTARHDVIETCRGDLRVVIQSLEYSSDIRDDFQSPREFLNSILKTNSIVNPVDYLGHPIQEPGNIVSIIHENYVNSRGRLDIIGEQLSQADLIETKIYAGDWDLLSYFNFWGCILPAREINHTIGQELRPGSTWTKYQNMCMREKKMKSISNLVPRSPLCLDSLLLIRSHLEHGNFEPFLEYGMNPSDLDILNHLSPINKLKAKTLSSLKKECAARCAMPKTNL
jgi:hypothetical protein